MLHKWASQSYMKLQDLFTKTSISGKRNSKKVKRFPFFLDFDGKSPLDYALANYDLQTFQVLIVEMINIQDCFESSYLVDSVIVEATRRNLDLRNLFESKICSQVVDRDTF